MPSSTSFIIFLILVTFAIVFSSIGIIISIKVQRRQKNKYKQLESIINENREARFKIKYCLTPEDIKKIDSTLDVNSLMDGLYNTYLELEKRLKRLDADLDGIVGGYLKDFYINKIQNFKDKGYNDIKDDINLLGYSITEFEANKLKFRINITCFDYKTNNGKIVSGSDSKRTEEVIILEYKKVNNKWLIWSYEKIYEKKLSE